MIPILRSFAVVVFGACVATGIIILVEHPAWMWISALLVFAAGRAAA